MEEVVATEVEGETKVAQEAPVCRHWQRMGWCLYAERCRFRHPAPAPDTGSSAPAAGAEGGGEASSSTTASLAEDRRLAFTKLSNERRQNRGAGRRNKIMNRSKAGAFRRWLADTFGREVLGSGTGVLDIAGGKGELSFELANLTGAPTTAVDPRPLQLDRFSKRLLVGIYHRTGPWQAYNHLPVPPDASHVRTPGHLRTFFDDHLLRLLDLHHRGQVDEAAGGFQDMLATARAVAWTEKGLVAQERDGDDDEEHNQEAHSAITGDHAADDAHTKEASEMDKNETDNGASVAGRSGSSHDDEGLVDWPAVQKLLAECSLIVGLHPDQATEAIVDFALLWNKGFAIVPCCVYHKQFPRRRLDGAPVTTYQQFVAYLTAKAPDRIKTATLDFEGKNIVLYALPPFTSD